MESAQAEDFDIILMDLDMAEKWMAWKQLQLSKQTIPSEHQKIIATTASLVTLSKEEMINLGFDDLILKPLKPQFYYTKW